MKTTLNERVGLRVRNRRIAMGLKQTDLAAKLGISYQQVQKYETGKDSINMTRLHAISKVLKVSPSLFLDDGIDAVPHGHNRQALSMVRYFHAIPCDLQRQRIVDLMRAMGGSYAS